MAEISGPWDSIGADRKYTAADWADFWGSTMIQDGIIFGRENSLGPSNAGTLSIDLNTGRAMKNGVRYKNTASLNLALLSVTSGNKRIDRLVIRFDPITNRAANAIVITGVETAGTPAAPAVVAGTDVKIAQILVDRSSGSYAYTVTDERDICLVGNVSNNKPVGEIFEMAGRVPISAAFPALPMWDADHTFGRATYPLAYDFLRSQKALAGSTEDHTVTVTGGVLSQGVPTNDWKALVAAIAEEISVAGSNQRYMTVNGVEYLITAASTGTWTVTCGAAGSGSQTATWYPYRTGASQVTLFKDQGRATMSWDGVTYINGARRRDRFQGHVHNVGVLNSAIYGSGSVARDAPYPIPGSSSVVASAGPTSDGPDGVPRYGDKTEPNSTVIFRYFWVGIIG